MPFSRVTADAHGVGQYFYLRTIGHGSFATVKLAWHKLTHAEVAIKIVSKKLVSRELLQRQHREVEIMKRLNHPHIVKLYEVMESDDALYLVMEYVACGELYDHLISRGRIKESTARNKFLQVFSALLYCHGRRIVHRDLKAENILVDAHLNLKIADFGLSNVYSSATHLMTFCGSAPYAAPEMYQGAKYTGPEVDIWSLGILLYVMTTSMLPFDGTTLHQIRQAVLSGKFTVPDFISPSTRGLSAFLHKIVVVDRSQRTSLTDFMSDPWLNEDGPVRERLLKLGLTEDDLQYRDRSVGRVLTFDGPLVDAMVSQFHFDRREIVRAIDQNLYNEVTAAYKLMQQDRARYVHEQVAATPPSPPSEPAHAVVNTTEAAVTSAVGATFQSDPPPINARSGLGNGNRVLPSSPSATPTLLSATPPDGVAAPIIHVDKDAGDRSPNAIEVAAAIQNETCVPARFPMRATRPTAGSGGAGDLATAVGATRRTSRSMAVPVAVGAASPIVPEVKLQSSSNQSLDFGSLHVRAVAKAPSNHHSRNPSSAAHAPSSSQSGAAIDSAHRTTDKPADEQLQRPMSVGTPSTHQRRGSNGSVWPANRWFVGGGHLAAVPAVRASMGSTEEAPDESTEPELNRNFRQAAPVRGWTVPTAPIAPLEPAHPPIAAYKVDATVVGTPSQAASRSPSPEFGKELPSTPPSSAPEDHSLAMFHRLKTKSMQTNASKGDQPRFLNFPFSSLTTSSKTPGQIFAEGSTRRRHRMRRGVRFGVGITPAQIIRVGALLDVDVQQTGPFSLSLSSFADDCTVEMEVCRIKVLFHTYGVVPRRVRGSSQSYKRFCNSLMHELRL